MAVTVKTSATATWAQNGSFAGEATFVKPASVTAGDLLVAHLSNASTGTVAPPTGWTLVQNQVSSVTTLRSAVFYRLATSSEPGSYVFDTPNANTWGRLSVLTGADPAAPVIATTANAGSSATAYPTALGANATAPAVGLALFSIRTDASITPPPGMSAIYEEFFSATTTRSAGTMTNAPVSGSTGDYIATLSTARAWLAALILIKIVDTPPNAPILTAPADASTIDRTATQRFDWDFSDPDAGDTQSAYNLRYRVVGAATWTETGWVSTPNTYHDVAGGTFADATDYEWQVATKDAQGVEGPYSTSSFFTAGTAPTAPTITEPTNGGTFTQSQTVSWSTPDQDAYQIRVLDGAAVVSDTGAVESTTARSAVLSFPTNGVTRTIQVRERDGGLWSQYAEVTGTVSWLAPPVPTFTITEDPAEGALVVSISNPAPSGAEPAAVYNDVYVTDPGKAEERRATMVAVNGSWTYHLPVSGYAYDGSDGSDIRVVAVAENGVTSST